MPTAAVFGATGATGKHILSTLLSIPKFTKVGEFGRRVTALDAIKSDKADTSKLVQKSIDFEKLDDEPMLKEHWDVVYISLGTTRAAAGSAEMFEKIDRDYVINAAKAVKSSGPQTIVYVSSVGANKTSSFLYPRSKGLTEEGLASLGYSDTIIFRLGVLTGAERAHPRIAERSAVWLVGIMGHITDSMSIDVGVLGEAVVTAGYLGSGQLPTEAQARQVSSDGEKFTLIGNAGAIRLAKHKIQ